MIHDNKTYTGKPIQYINKMFQISMPKRFGARDDWYFKENKKRENIDNIFDKESIYTFIMTAANPKAVEALAKKKSLPKKYFFDSEEEFQKMYSITGSKSGKELGIYFGPDLMDLYMHTVDAIMKSAGKDNYISYKIVETKNVHSVDRLVECIFWPTVHVLRDIPESRLTNTLKNLNGDEAYQIIRKRELPQCYRMGEVKFLRKKNIDPIIVLPKRWSIKGEQLKDAVEFLLGFKLSYEPSPDYHFDGNY